VNKRLRARAERWRVWHLWAGLCSAVLLLNLAITGIFLNHTDDLGLDRHHVNYRPLLQWYGFKPPGRAARLYVGTGQLLQLDEGVYLNGQRVVDSLEPVIAACSWSELLFVLSATRITLLTPGGELVETVNLPANLLGQIDRAGCSNVGPVIESAGQLLSTDEMASEWRRVPSQPDLSWSIPELLLPQERSEAYRLYHQHSLTWERLLLDLHSGRLLGLPGVILVDAAALLLLLQLVSGVYLFLRTGR